MRLNQNISEFRNVLLFALLALLWGTSYVAIDVGLRSLPPVLFAAIRYDVAGALLVAVALARGVRLRPRTRSEWTAIAVGGVFIIAIHIATLFLGQRSVNGGTAAIVLSTVPVLTPLFARVVLGDRFGPRTAVGAGLGLAGVAVIAGPGSLGASVEGVGLLLVSASSFALGAVLLERLPSDLPATAEQAWMMLAGSALLHVVSPVLGEPTVMPTTASLGALIYLAVAAGAGGYLVYFDLLDHVGSVKVSLVNYAVPVVAAISGWMLLGDALPATAAAGFALVAFGFGISQWDGVVNMQARIDRGYAAENEYVTDVSATTSDGTFGDTSSSAFGDD